MNDTIPNDTQIPMGSIGVADFLRGMANDQTSQQHALAMGQAQMRQMMGENWKDPEPESDDMKIAAGPITETTNHFHYHKEGEAGGPAAGPPAAESPSDEGPSAFRRVLSRFLPLAIASTLGASGVLLGQLAQGLTTPSKPTTPEPPPPTESNHDENDAPLIISPDRPDLMWELDLGRPGKG